jgi:hypothetical protein
LAIPLRKRNASPTKARSLLPLIERSGIANIAEIGINTLAERLREDAVANDRVIFLSRVVGAWARLT